MKEFHLFEHEAIQLYSRCMNDHDLLCFKTRLCRGRGKATVINHIIVSYENPSRGTQEVVCLYILASFSSLTYSSRLNHTS